MVEHSPQILASEEKATTTLSFLPKGHLPWASHAPSELACCLLTSSLQSCLCQRTSCVRWCEWSGRRWSCALYRYLRSRGSGWCPPSSTSACQNLPAQIWQKSLQSLHHHHHHHQSLNHEGHWGNTDDSATTFLHSSPFSTALWDLPNSRPIHPLM